MKVNFAKLISEKECISLIPGILSEEEIKNNFLFSIFDKLMENLSQDIHNAKLENPHIFRFEVRVHAQEKIE